MRKPGLVLSRRQDEGVVITVPPGQGQRIDITVIEVVGNRARLHIAAADEVKVNRSEIQDKIDSERQGES